MNRVHVEPVSGVRAGNLQEQDYLHKLVVTRTQFAAVYTLGFTGWTAPTTRQVLTSSYELSAVLCSARPTQGTMYSSTNLAPCKLTHVPRPCCARKLRNRQVDGNMRCYRTHNRKSCYKFIRRRHLRRCTCVPEI